MIWAQLNAQQCRRRSKASTTGLRSSSGWRRARPAGARTLEPFRIGKEGGGGETWLDATDSKRKP